MKNGQTVAVLTGLTDNFGITGASPGGQYPLMVMGTPTNPNYIVDLRSPGS